MRLRLFVLLLALTAVLSANVATDSYIVDRFVNSDGEEIVVCTTPVPKGVSEVPEGVTPSRASVILPNVPAIDWSYGCSATSAAMYMGYLDRIGLSNLYNGPTNGGVFPIPSAGVNYWGYDGQGNYQCPLAATKGGIDGQIGPVHVDDYWVEYDNIGNDPIGDDTNWPGHVQADCTGDFMGTSQDYWNNSDGGTTFYNYSSGTRLYDYTGGETASPRKRDGAHGFRLFVESRGYEVYSNFNQYILPYNTNTNGMSFADFCKYIDAGYPVLIHVQGHTMLAVGYDDATNTVYIHDTWGFTNQSMTWGGSYSGMAQYAMTVLVTENPNYVAAPFSEDFEGGYPCANWRLLKNTDKYTSDFTVDAANTGGLGLEMTTTDVWGYDTSGGTTVNDMWTKAQPGGSNENFTQYADLNIDLDELNAPMLAFDLKMGYNTASYYNNFWVMLEDESGVWHQMYSTQSWPTSWTTQYADLSAYIGQKVRLRFFHNGASGSYPCYVDNVAIQETPTAPVVTGTTTPWGVLYHRAQSGGTIASDGGATINGRGVCWMPAPTVPYGYNFHYGDENSAIGDFDILMTGLQPNTEYNVRSYASNSFGTTYGPMVTFTTPAAPGDNTGTVTLIDGDGEFPVPNVALDFYFTGIYGAWGDDITVDDFAQAPTAPGPMFLASGNTADCSVLITNNNHIDFTSCEMRFNVDDLEALIGGGIYQEYFVSLENGEDSKINLWRRDDYSLGDFVMLGALLYHDNNGVNGDADDYLYYAVTGFSEFAFSSTFHSLPVTLSSFNAVCNSEGAVQIDWITQSETNAAGFNLYRDVDNDIDEAMLMTPALIPATNQSTAQNYRFTDADVDMDETYNYWLESVDLSGSSTLYGPAQVTVTDPGGSGDIPDPEMITALNDVYPNPFNPSTTLQYTLADESNVRLAVYNLRGQLVRELDEGVRSQGNHSVVWDGLDANGAGAGSGVYLFRLETGDQTFVRKGILMK